MRPIISAAEAASMIQSGSSVMFGGFLGCGNPHALVEALLAGDARGLTLIANDTAFPEYGIGRLIVAKRVCKVITSHMGSNPHTGAQMHSGETEVELVPQGTLAERIRCGGTGLGGVLTPTGVGTMVEEGKQRLTVNGRDYLLELPLRADVALIKAHTADRVGNLVYRLATRNFNPLMAMAADLVIAEVEEIVEPGGLHPDTVHTPGIFVDYLVQAPPCRDCVPGS